MITSTPVSDADQAAAEDIKNLAARLNQAVLHARQRGLTVHVDWSEETLGNRSFQPWKVFKVWRSY